MRSGLEIPGGLKVWIDTKNPFAFITLIGILAFIASLVSYYKTIENLNLLSQKLVESKIQIEKLENDIYTTNLDIVIDGNEYFETRKVLPSDAAILQMQANEMIQKISSESVKNLSKSKASILFENSVKNIKSLRKNTDSLNILRRQDAELNSRKNIAMYWSDVADTSKKIAPILMLGGFLGWINTIKNAQIKDS